MAIYTALIAAWNNATQPPPGVTGPPLTALSTEQKIVAINSWTVPAPQKAILTPSQILNAVVPSDLATLTIAQVALLTLILQGSTVDGSAGTTVRAAAQAIFAGKATTLANLGALVATFDSAVLPWWRASVAQNGGGLNCSVSAGDISLAGLS